MIALNQSDFSDPEWLGNNQFEALRRIASAVDSDEDKARECLIRLLEHRDVFAAYEPILDALLQRVGLFPYVGDDLSGLSTSDLLNLEAHVPHGMHDVVLHSMQARVYRALMDGANVILSAPTSFGKSLLIDAAIASGRYDNIVVIVPTIALIDETRRRLSRRFGQRFRVITHPTQKGGERNIYVYTQERFVEEQFVSSPEFFVIDEFYKLSPDRGDDRTFVLNHAFYKLFKTGAQFLLIGPNVSNITVNQEHLDFRYFDTPYSTVVSEVRHLSTTDTKLEALKICRTLQSPTLIFCKSSNSAYKLARYMAGEGLSARNNETEAFSDWIGKTYHPDWDLVPLLREGFAIHHGALPRSIAYHMLRKFNEGVLKFLLCTSTIIEGVNTSAQNIILYDNKVATRKFDFFTFNNIKGRAGRMLRHFVGHVYVLNYEVQQELPFVDIPAITQPDDAPQSLLVQLDERDLSEHSLRKLRYLHAQDYLPIDVIRANAGVSPMGQVAVAEKIAGNLRHYHSYLAWQAYPTKEQRIEVCKLIFDGLMESRGHDGVFGWKQLNFQIGRFTLLKDIPTLIRAELAGNNRIDTATEAIENVLLFLRRWAEFYFPRYLCALDKIQRHVFSNAGMTAGNYEGYASEIKRLYMPLSATVLEEYGLPYQISLVVEKRESLGDSVDAIVSSLKRLNLGDVKLSPFEAELLQETISSL